MSELTFQEAVARHRAGDLAAAEALYERVLASDASHDRACFLLGSLLHEAGRTSGGVAWLKRAAELAPGTATFQAALGEALRQSGEGALSLVRLECAAQLEPQNAQLQLSFARALCDNAQADDAIGYLQCASLLGGDGARAARQQLHVIWAEQASSAPPESLSPEAKRRPVRAAPLSPSTERAFRLAQEQHRAGRLKEAEPHYRKLLKTAPKYAAGQYWYGLLALESDRLTFGLDLLARACALEPDNADYHSNLGEAYVRAQRFEPGIAAFRCSLALESQNAERHFNLGIALRLAGDRPAALRKLGDAIRLAPENPRFQLELARELQDAARPRRAIGHFHAALAVAPDAASLLELAALLHAARCFDAAIQRCRQSLLLDDSRAEAHHLLGRSLSEAQHLDQAIESLQHAARANPELPGVHADLAAALLGSGRVEEAVLSWERALERDPSDAVSDSNRLFALGFHDGFDDAAIAVEAQRWALRHEAPLAASLRPHAAPGVDAANKKLRIGYVCSVFREHALGFVILPLIAHRSRQDFEVYCYSSVTRPDALTERLKSEVDVWCDVAAHSDEQLAELIREHEVDILFDLNMHMATSRLRVFARRPAPLQISGWSYPGTTGLSQIDYRVTDRHLDPPGATLPYSEASLVLPDSYWCYDPFTDRPQVGPLPALTGSGICFGNLNGAWKQSPRSVALWSKVLHAVPGSRMLLLSPGWHDGPSRRVQGAEARISSCFEREGIDAARVQFVPRTSRLAYFDYYHRIDVGLDSLPYAGHTTSLDALWMGVPTLSLPGRTVVGRSGVTLASNLGLPELLASNEAELVERARTLTRDLGALAALRAGLRERVQSSPLMDGPRFARNMEAAFRAAWQRHCEGGAPTRIDLSSSAAP